tara:strand:+ start:4301 stop:6331 length:2031 start_codon:yes stop_codon:yes gene_type:complete
MIETDINELELKAIPELMGKNFFIPDYQRGYRWQEIHIFQLLSDIWDFSNKNSGDFYCLQPIVVKECGRDVIEKYALNSEYDDNKWYEVIDGQQRLTTIRLIIQMNNIITPISRVKNCYNLFYQTRPELKDVFETLEITNNNDDLSVAIDRTTIDSFYITSGLKHIVDWFNLPGKAYEKRATMQQFPSFFSVFFGEKSTTNSPRQGKSTQIIWYEVNQIVSKFSEGTDSKKLFNRLNDSKIPLTNSELIKALFLSEDSKFKLDYISGTNEDEDAQKIAIKIDKAKKQNHIAKKWDMIEHSLGNTKFWHFTTNSDVKEYSSKIELLFNLVSEKHTKNKKNSELNKNDDLFTFLYFDRMMRKGKDLWEIWMEIELYFETISYWFDNRELYHKVGYLICINGDTILIDLLHQAANNKKDEFLEHLNLTIRESVNFDLAQINYKEHYEDIQRLLVLYNVEAVRKLESLEFYPFHLHKELNWTLEHIHAQNSDNLSRDDKDSWYNWIDEHIPVLKSITEMNIISQLDKNELKVIIENLQTQRKNQKLDFLSFLNEYNRVIKFFELINNLNDKGNTVHFLSNMALLGGIENTKLSNSVFEVKRKKILQMDASGSYIPLCTKNVFLKYHNVNEENFAIQQLYFWGENDRKNYLAHINDVLSEYLTIEMLSPIAENINLELETE